MDFVTLLVLALAAFPLALCNVHVYQIPDTVVNGSISATFNSAPGNVDTLNISPGPNATSYEWWYFDAISAEPGSNATIAVNFVLTGAEAVAVLGFGPLAPAGVAILGSFANGTAFGSNLGTQPLNGASVTITVDPDTISGTWHGTGLGFTGPLGGGSVYTVTVNAPDVGIQGVITLQPIAKAHYACGLDTPGQSEIYLPNFAWSNAVPDAIASAHFLVNGEPFNVEGIGYHDKSWGVVPLGEVVISWYGGHARVGPYSVAWIDGIDSAGQEIVTIFISKCSGPLGPWCDQTGNVLLSACGQSVATVRPWGPNSEYPPTSAASPPGGFTLEAKVAEGTFLINMTVKATITQGATIFERFVGPVSGGIVGKDHYTGTAYFEAFAL